MRNEDFIKEDINGKYYLDTTVLKIPGHEKANCHVTIYFRHYLNYPLKEVYCITLTSYKTNVLSIHPEVSTKANGICTGVSVSGLYSMTTRKHISWFIGCLLGWAYPFFRKQYEKAEEKTNVFGTCMKVFTVSYRDYLKDYGYILHCFGDGRYMPYELGLELEQLERRGK